jgi:hypothetical protein
MAAIAGQHIVRLIADQNVVAGTAAGVFDQRAQIALIQPRVGDVAGG